MNSGTDLELFSRETPSVAVIGLGYVGLPLALELVRGGCRVVGVDIDESKASALMEGRSYIKDISPDRITSALSTGRFGASTDMAAVREVDAIIIAVPTPLGPARDPDLSFVLSTAEGISAHLRKGQLVVLE
ncbi:UDP-N-acetyl-D-glucosamine dehydrogenase, partial [Candidatus Fermentibacterales bacterium]|nr:UDP-N-acetyl-D-glucosamine dehydrogenase [Candidatus Fermentibacterales bacterium]